MTHGSFARWSQTRMFKDRFAFLQLKVNDLPLEYGELAVEFIIIEICDSILSR